MRFLRYLTGMYKERKRSWWDDEEKKEEGRMNSNSLWKHLLLLRDSLYNGIMPEGTQFESKLA